MKISSAQIRQKYLKFFADRGHAIIPSASLVPENDPTTLFTSSGMQPLVPYLLGQKHPAGKRLVNSQKSFRAQDIEEIGDNRHTTFFEMLGNWSLGDYFKKEQLSWIFEFLTKELELDPKQLYITVFQGNSSVPKDIESIKIWKELFQSVGMVADENERIFAYPAQKNWWSRSGEPDKMPAKEPGGPDSEVFFDFGQNLLIHEKSRYKNEQCHPNCDCGRFMEIANSVFMQYQKQPDGSLQELRQKNVDFGGGLERLAAVVNNNPDIFKTDLYISIIQIIEKITGHSYLEKINRPPMRIIADHLKAASFLIVDDVYPFNKTRGYILRRLLRRSAVKLYALTDKTPQSEMFNEIASNIIQTYQNTDYFDPIIDLPKISSVISEEINKFGKVLAKGIKMIEKTDSIDAKSAFDLYQSYGFPIELTAELLEQKGQKINLGEFKDEFEKHQNISRTASKGMFKGGLIDHSEAVTKLHTATHLLHTALRKFVGTNIQQKGSNITSERLRFDFTQSTRLTDKQKQDIEIWINQQIAEDLPVTRTIDSLSGAKAGGALAFFGEKYGEKVTVYTIGNEKTGIVSQEVCGGPHVTRTGVLGSFKLGKEETVSAGVRRVYAFLKPK
ncbi:alanine--tRNA ligase [Candidatus Collierbacteria bacterium]|nr:alanine--tRNA ligase [Candidatus Collierbacteria bacterium]